jgi:hypothetical protein
LDHRLTGATSADIADILRETTRGFDDLQRDTYAGLIDHAIKIIGETGAARRLCAAAHLLSTNAGDLSRAGVKG